MKVKHLLLTAALGLSACASEAPKLGLSNNSLISCPESPNCVSSMAEKTDQEHFITPLNYAVKTEIAHAALVAHLKTLPDVKIEKADSDYIHATFTTRFMRFVDDVEFYFTAAEPVIHVRSASRTGRSDMGVNRKRIEALRAELQKKLN